MKNDPKTSWDSFSYTLQMAHNVWMHIKAVQEANEAYDKGINPHMLVEEKFDRIAFKDIVHAIFATSSRDEANAVIEEFSRFWMSIIGTRGATGKKTVNASTQFGNLFEEV
jgi:truncated hemoglobin YjbI